MQGFKDKKLSITRIVLALLISVVALNAFGGGYYGLAGASGVPAEWLEGSPFKTYVIPSLFLLIVVGGLSAAAATALFMNLANALLLSFLAGAMMIAWILLQVTIIGYVSWLQPGVLFIGIAVLLLLYYLKRNRVGTSLQGHRK